MDGKPALDRTRCIREAIASGEFPKAMRLWEQYAEDLRGAIQTQTATPSRMEEMKDLVDWSRTVVSCARAQALQGLAATRRIETVAAAYGQSSR